MFLSSLHMHTYRNTKLLILHCVISCFYNNFDHGNLSSHMPSFPTFTRSLCLSIFCSYSKIGEVTQQEAFPDLHIQLTGYIKYTSLFSHCTLYLIPLVHLPHHCVISIKVYVGFLGGFCCAITWKQDQDSVSFHFCIPNTQHIQQAL